MQIKLFNIPLMDDGSCIAEMNKLGLLLFFLLCAFTSKAQVNENNALAYIKDYYSNFSTGYSFDGKYNTISENYKAEFSGSLFTLTFDSFDEQNNIMKQNITFNLKDVISMEPNGTDMVEILDYDPFALPICGKLAFKTKTEEYNINIYYEVDDDVEQTEIYKAFEVLINSYKK